MKTLQMLLGAALASGALVARPAAAIIIPGGPTAKPGRSSADCYGEVEVDLAGGERRHDEREGRGDRHLRRRR